MVAPKQLPSVHSNRGYKESAKEYATKMVKDLKVSGIENALARAYLDGAQSAIRVGYMLAEEDYKEVIKYYESKIKQYGD